MMFSVSAFWFFILWKFKLSMVNLFHDWVTFCLPRWCAAFGDEQASGGPIDFRHLSKYKTRYTTHIPVYELYHPHFSIWCWGKPGPRKPIYPCQICHRAVTRGQKGVSWPRWCAAFGDEQVSGADGNWVFACYAAKWILHVYVQTVKEIRSELRHPTCYTVPWYIVQTVVDMRWYVLKFFSFSHCVILTSGNPMFLALSLMSTVSDSETGCYINTLQKEQLWKFGIRSISVNRGYKGLETLWTYHTVPWYIVQTVVDMRWYVHAFGMIP
jgi:hypothetical protein